MHRQLVGSLTLGLIGNATLEQNGLIARAIARFRQRDEAVRLSLLIRGPRELEELILKDEMQVAVGYFLHRVPMLDYATLFQERQVAIAARATRWRPAPAAWARATWPSRTGPGAPIRCPRPPSRACRAALPPRPTTWRPPRC